MLFLKKISDILDAEDAQGPPGATSAAERHADSGDGSQEAAAGTAPLAEAKLATGAPLASDSCGPSETGSRAGSEWEVVAVSGGPGAEASAALADAEAAARQLQVAARAAEALAPRLSQALRRAEEAEAEVARLAASLAQAEVRIEAMQAQQLRLTEGFLGEIRQRDAELAVLRAQVSAATPESKPAAPTGSTEPKSAAAGMMGNPTGLLGAARSEGAEVVDVLTFTDEGPLGIAFDEANSCLKVVGSVDTGSSAFGRVAVGDEVISIDGVSARGLSWEELEQALMPRPVVLSVRRAEGAAQRPGGPGLGLAGRVRHLAGWTRAAAQAAARELEAAMADLDSTDAAAPAADALAADAPEDAEARNRPFYELVRTSMVEACVMELRIGGPGAKTEAAFERWLRDFHSERDDGWYANNHLRVYNAFRPHWDEVVAAQRALVAS